MVDLFSMVYYEQKKFVLVQGRIHNLTEKDIHPGSLNEEKLALLQEVLDQQMMKALGSISLTSSLPQGICFQLLAQFFNGSSFHDLRLKSILPSTRKFPFSQHEKQHHHCLCSSMCLQNTWECNFAGENKTTF